jgi:SNF2 family DNA or RNA helicase
MPKEQRDAYDLAARDLIFMVDQACEKCDKKDTCNKNCDDAILIKNTLVGMMKLSQITAGFFINTTKKIDDAGKVIDISNTISFDDNQKLALLMNVIETIPFDRKIIIWSNFIHPIKKICEKLEAAYGRESYISIYGDDDALAKVDMFEKQARFLVANQSKAGTGLNLQFSNYMIFYSNNYSFRLRDQAEARQHRQGQRDPVTIIDLACNKSIDGYIAKVLKDKKELAEELTSLARLKGIIHGQGEHSPDKNT